MKACSAHLVLKAVARAGLWIDAVSGNEVLRAQRAGFAMGAEPPVVMLTADVFRDNALAVVREQGVLPNIGSPGQLRELATAGYRGPIGAARQPRLRTRPRAGVRHRRSELEARHVDRRGSSAMATAAREAGLPVVLLHAHVGSGPQIDELYANLQRLGARLRGPAAALSRLRAR